MKLDALGSAFGTSDDGRASIPQPGGILQRYCTLYTDTRYAKCARRQRENISVANLLLSIFRENPDSNEVHGRIESLVAAL